MEGAAKRLVREGYEDGDIVVRLGERGEKERERMRETIVTERVEIIP